MSQDQSPTPHAATQDPPPADVDAMSRLHPDVRVWLNHQLNLTLDELNQGGVAAETSHIETALYYGWRRHPQPEDRWLWKNIVLELGPPSSVTPRPARQPSTDHREKRQRIDATPPPPVTLLPNQTAASQQARGRPGAPPNPVPPQPKSTTSCPPNPDRCQVKAMPRQPLHMQREWDLITSPEVDEIRQRIWEKHRAAKEAAAKRTASAHAATSQPDPTTQAPPEAQPGATAVKTEPEDTTTPAPEATSAPQRVTVVTRYANKQPSENQPDSLPLHRQPSPEQSLDYNRTISNDSAPTLPGQDDTSPEPSSATERDNSPEPENTRRPTSGADRSPHPHQRPVATNSERSRTTTDASRSPTPR